MTRRCWFLLLGSGLAAVFWITAHLFINTTFMLYDDEGYLLLTLRAFAEGGRLYDGIFTQYGPWPYVYHQAVSFLTQQPLTHALGRSLTAMHWVVCAVAGAALVASFTRHVAATLFAGCATFMLLWQMSAEPSHPGSLIAALVAGAALLTVTAQRAGRWAWLGAGSGAIAALLLLTKINVGLLFVAGVGFAALRLTRWPPAWQRPARWLSAVGLLLLPWGLMFSRIDDPRVLVFAVQFSLAAAGLIWTQPASQPTDLPPRTWLLALGAGLGTGAVIVALVLLQGTSLQALLQAVLLNPLRQPAQFLLPFKWPAAVWPVAVICTLTLARAGWELRRRGALTPATRWLLIGVRGAVAAGLLIHLPLWTAVQGIGLFIAFCLPLVPVFAIPLGSNLANGRPGLVWLASLALPQVLHAYPVAGSQMGWGTFLLASLLATGLHDAGQALAEAVRGRARLLPRAAWAALLAGAVFQFGSLTAECWQNHRTSRPLDLPGAENVRLPERTRLALRLMTLNAALHADTLFSRPGLFSFNLWSGVPTPTQQNATHWFWLLSDAQQQAIADVLRARPRSAVIVNSGWDSFLQGISVPVHSGLRDFIEAHYQPLVEFEGMSFQVPRGSPAAAFGKAGVQPGAPRSGDSARPFLLAANVVLAGRPHAVFLRDLDRPGADRGRRSILLAGARLDPITSHGRALGPAVDLPASRPLAGLYHLTVATESLPAAAELSRSVLVIEDEAGNVLSESVF